MFQNIFFTGVTFFCNNLYENKIDYRKQKPLTPF